MGWEMVKREDFFEGSDSPFISISDSHFMFSAAFVRNVDLQTGWRASIFVDSENRKIGFEFHKEERTNSFSIY